MSDLDKIEAPTVTHSTRKVEVLFPKYAFYVFHLRERSFVIRPCFSYDPEIRARNLGIKCDYSNLADRYNYRITIARYYSLHCLMEELVEGFNLSKIEADIKFLKQHIQFNTSQEAENQS